MSGFGLPSGRQPSVMSHSFGQVPSATIPRSQFNRSHGWKGTFNAGYLIPVFLDEALPGDTLNLKMTAFARLATPIVPVMDNLYCDSFFFAVPYRLLWSHWVNFNGEQETPGDSTDYVIPQTQLNGGFNVVVNGDLGDNFGLPPGVSGSGLTVSALPFRAYSLIWNQWFRDQNLQNPVGVSLGDGPDTYSTISGLLRRGKRGDYFTTCLPWPQKAPSVTIPWGQSTLPVISSGTVDWVGSASGATGSLYAVNNTRTSPAGWSTPTGALPDTNENINYLSGLEVDLGATSGTINALRQAFQLQRMFERDARGGTRYTEVVRAHFGVVSPDARLQRAEYLGGSSHQISFTPIPQTSSTDGTTPQGNLAATATLQKSGDGFVRSFTEHCIIIGLISVRADLNYQQGINRMWSRNTRFDFYWPALSHIGEQAVLNQEIFAQGNSYDSEVFGYQERYAEYRYKPSQITGQFRSTFATPLDMWHLAQKFTSLPALNDNFIHDATDGILDRIVAVEDAPQFLCDCYFDYKCARPMPTYSVPGMVDHF